MAGEYDLKPSFPIAPVAELMANKGVKEYDARAKQNQQLVDGIQNIGTVATSLYAKRQKVAQALAIGRQFDIPDDVAKMMEPEEVLKVGAIKKGQIDMNSLLNLIHPGTGGTTPQIPGTPAIAPTTASAKPAPAQAPVAAPVSPSPTIPALSPSPLTPSTTGSMPVPIPAPPLTPRMVNQATMNAALKISAANRMDPVVTQEKALADGSVAHGTHIVTPKSELEVGLKEQQFYQKEWDKLLKESDPLSASNRNPLGLATRATFQANRALKTLSNPVVANQEAGNAMADIAAIYQGGSPTQFGMSHQQYETLYGKAQGLIQSISGKPQDALPDPIKNRLIGVLQDMKRTNSALLKQRLDMTEHSKKSVISHFPDEWKEYRQILEGDQGHYDGLAPAASSGSGVPLVGQTFNGAKVLSVKRIK